MVERFIEEYAKKIALYPEKIRAESRRDGENVEIILYASQEDMGKFIGKNGKMIHSLKTVLSGCKVKNGLSCRISIQSL
ncbi:RNA-binding protein [Helicobacter enhydrae]|uniref:RNA-binding protein n=1 Tax=Helicobacter enhydrae TaxID=222136 RepID=A0A1B1U4Z4_9HELI|nr:KH domain-containing protein [Helicobacter enhydrae]ANV97826.1 RNA-binding protein [Helicobacter enhydrae]